MVEIGYGSITRITFMVNSCAPQCTMRKSYSHTSHALQQYAFIILVIYVLHMYAIASAPDLNTPPGVSRGIFFDFTENLWPKFSPLFIFPCIFVITIFSYLIKFAFNYTYIILYIIRKRAHGNIFTNVCVCVCSMYHHVISRHASRGDGNYLISSGIIFFPRRQAQV